MTLLILFAGADFVAAPVVPDAAGFAFLEEIHPYKAQLEEVVLYSARLEEVVVYGAQLKEEQ